MARSVCFSCNADSGVGPLLDGWTSVPVAGDTLFACPRKGCKWSLSRYLGIAGDNFGAGVLGRSTEERAEDERWWAGHYERQMRGTVD